MDTTKPHTIDPEFARLLKQAAAAGEPIAVTIDDQTYTLTVSPEPATQTADLWRDYDPERIRSAIAEMAGIFTDEEAEKLIEQVHVSRAEGSRPANR